MKVTFIGGGAFRILPIVRGAFAMSKALDGGEINLFDFNVSRAEAMGRMIMRSPEYGDGRCKVRWDASLEEALEGTDLVQIGFPVGDPVAAAYSDYHSHKYGFLSSDQLSATGAFLALQGGPIILNYARQMEKYCPQAWLAIFANPVAVYSGLVNNHTSIRAMGVCGGYANHTWDLSRLLGKDEQCGDYDVEVAGINHLSFILRGRLHDEDLFTVLDRHLTDDWRPPHLLKRWKSLHHHIRYSLRREIELLRNFRTLIFSTEGDGMAHLFYEDMYINRTPAKMKKPSPAIIEAGMARGKKAREAMDTHFRTLLVDDLDAHFWATYGEKDRTFLRADYDATVKIIRALGGDGEQKLVTSYLNRGAVAGFTDRTVLEYSQILDPTGLRPYGTLAVPPAFHGLISALAMHQTLLGDAIATEDPGTLYQALFSYPIKFNTKDSRKCYRELLDIHQNVIAPAFRETKALLK